MTIYTIDPVLSMKSEKIVGRNQGREQSALPF
jgi:hypothetical protein